MATNKKSDFVYLLEDASHISDLEDGDQIVVDAPNKISPMTFHISTYSVTLLRTFGPSREQELFKIRLNSSVGELKGRGILSVQDGVLKIRNSGGPDYNTSYVSSKVIGSGDAGYLEAKKVLQEAGRWQ